MRMSAPSSAARERATIPKGRLAEIERMTRATGDELSDWFAKHLQQVHINANVMMRVFRQSRDVKFARQAMVMRDIVADGLAILEGRKALRAKAKKSRSKKAEE